MALTTNSLCTASTRPKKEEATKKRGALGTQMPEQGFLMCLWAVRAACSLHRLKAPCGGGLDNLSAKKACNDLLTSLLQVED